MKLTEEQLQIVIEKLKGFAPDGIICPVCGNKKWNLLNLVYELKEYEKEENLIGKKTVIPLISLLCKNCSNSLFFNAIRLGIIKNDFKENDNSDISKE